ncbi:hypothetical protein C8J57DRAFT_1233623 [Mycena rebaudengoi]|nr:hypothetical protein C8J57DRAFT_1233623 [Mycena rebaudengoi]
MSYRGLGRPGLLSARHRAHEQRMTKIQPYPLRAKCGQKHVPCCICFSTPNKPVINLGIHWAFGTAAPDNAYEMELSDAIREGLVEPSASDTPEKLYDWDGVVFATD